MNETAAIPRAIVEAKIIEIVARALERKPESVTLTARLWDDLGAESLDLLDIAFGLEREFHIRLPHSDLLQRASDLLGDRVILQEGRLTASAAALIRELMPELNPSKIEAGLRPMDFRRMITLESFVRVVQRVLAAKDLQRCAACGGQLRDGESPSEMECVACGVAFPLPSGESVVMEDLVQAAERLGLTPIAAESRAAAR